MRILIDLPEHDVAALDRLGKEAKVSRAQIIREALGGFLKARTRGAETDAFGLWSGRAEDGLEYQRKLRAEW